MSNKSESEKLAGTANGCLRAIGLLVIGGVGIFVFALIVGSC